MTNQVFLASKSPRRNQLLTWAGFDVRVIASNNHTLYAFEGDEELQPAELPEPYVRRTALNKFREGLALRAKLYKSLFKSTLWAGTSRAYWRGCWSK